MIKTRRIEVLGSQMSYVEAGEGPVEAFLLGRTWVDNLNQAGRVA